MKKGLSLLLAFVLSMTIFVADIMQINMIVRAEEVGDGYVEDGQSGDPIDSNPEAQEAYQKWLDEQAQQANEQQQQQDDDAAREAREKQQRDEEEAERARKEAEEAEKKRQEQEAAMNYSLSLSNGQTAISSVDFGSCEVGTQRDYRPVYVTNTGSGPIDLIATEVGDADSAFSLSSHSDNAIGLQPGSSVLYYVSMNSSLPVGTYSAKLLFASSADPTFTRATALQIKGTVAGKESKITSIAISPANATVAVGSSYDYNATVYGTGDYDDGVLFSISGNRSNGTHITQNGNKCTLTVAADETSTNITLMANSVVNRSIAGYASATPQRNSYTVSASCDPSNGGYTTGGGAVSQGGSVTLSAVPNKNFYFAGWVINGQTVSTATNYTVSNVQSNIGVTAKFAQRSVTVTAVANNKDGGNVIGGGTVSYGGSTTLSAKAYNGYVFTGWVEGNTVVSRDASIKLENLTVDRKLTAMFEKTTHTLTLAVYPQDTGKVEGGGTFDLGKGTTIKATAYDGYEFQGWKVNDQFVSYNREYKIDKITQDYTCTAIFIKKNVPVYEISSGVATTGGSISPSGKSNVAQGTNLTYTITPKSGFAILAVAVDGVQVGAVSSYTFTNVQGPHTISAAFVQTDAGQKAATSSGKPVQTNKVETVAKTASNTAPAQSTVSIDEAAAGDAGDDYVEEMDLTNIAIPTDEELGITDEIAAPSSAVTQMLGMSLDEVSAMITSGNTMPVLDAAFYTGSLGAYVENAYAPKSMVSIDYQNMTAEELMMATDDTINPSLPDLDVVVQRMLSTDDVMKLAKGGHVDIAVSLSGMDKPDAVSERIMKNAVGQKPVQYFDLTMLKSADGYTERVTELPTTMEVVIEIPDEYFEKGKTYSVLRIHNGELSVLPDLDDDPKTITFRTDRFSTYAIAKQVTSANNLVAWLVAGAALAFGVAMTCFLILIAHQRKYVKARKHAH